MGDFLVNLSVLLATYNGEKYLPGLLASLSAQTLRCFQVLYQDDGSSDKTSEIISRWAEKDSRFHAASHQGEHLGAAGNFISLLSQCKGDLIFLCDQDDVWEADKLETMVREYSDLLPARGMPPESGMTCPPILIHSDASVIDEDGHQLHPSFFVHQGWDPRAVTLNRLLVQNNVTGCLMMMNRPLADLVISHGDPSKMFMHDWFIALSAASFGLIHFCNRPLVRYRQHGDNSIGASQRSLVCRGFKALGRRRQSRARIALTYSHAAAFREAYGSSLPPAADELIGQYLATRCMHKVQRLIQIRKHNFLMQSPITRLGQIFFG